jgi:hypothetical protein
MNTAGNNREESVVTVLITVLYPVEGRCRKRGCEREEAPESDSRYAESESGAQSAGRKNLEICSKLLSIQCLFGGPDRDRTDDLFHAMVGVKTQIIDGTVHTSRHNRQKRHNWRYLLPICCQIYLAGQRADRVGSARLLLPWWAKSDGQSGHAGVANPCV